MAENESFFKKMVRFVANPATEWNELSTRQDDNKELELEKSELKAMIERKRRNDFVRKREFDTLRRVRREGLSPEQLATLGTSSRLDDSDVRLPDGPVSSPTGVKAKIDEIEQQMVGEPGFNHVRTRHSQSGAPVGPGGGARSGGSTGHYTGAPTQPAVLARDQPQRMPGGGTGASAYAGLHTEDSDLLPALPPLMERRIAPPPSAPVQMGNGLPPLAPMATISFDGAGPQAAPGAGAQPASAIEVSEVVHDPELDEAVIAFANADFGHCEESLRRAIRPDGARAHHAETWLVLFDLYRATGQQQSFESLALDYAHQFGWSAPQWYSLPQMVADAAPAEPSPITSKFTSTANAAAGWVCPAQLDVEALARLRSQTLQMPLPWVLNWSGLRGVDPEAAMQLSTLLRLWSGQALEMRWNGGEKLLAVLQDAAPTGMRDADPVYWLTRMDALRLVNRPDQFDEAAIDYCVTYEVSPPSWEPTRCKVQVSEEGLATHVPPAVPLSELPTNFMESALLEDAATGMEVAKVELSGQLVGDISGTLTRMLESLGQAQVVSVSCLRLIRVDFIAAGDLLNWVLSRRQENRAVHLVDTHRLVALFFGAMGINEHAKVQVRKV